MRANRPGDSKLCATCGRRIAWRRKWARNWDEVRHCSKRCRCNRPGAVDRQIERAIVELLESRAGTICPSDAARAARPDDWREWMEPTRQAARRLVAREVVEIRQKGRAVDPSTAKGAIRIARGRRWG